MDDKKLIDKLLKASAAIESANRSKKSNYMIVSQAVASAIQDFRRNHRKGKIIRIFNEKI